MGYLSISYLFCLSLGTTLYGDAVQGILDLSVPTYSTEYQGYHINIFKDTSVTSVPTFYYAPACFLLHSATGSAAKISNPQYVTIKIGLWDEEYIQHIRSYLSETEGIPVPRIKPVPFKWMRIDSINNWQISQLGTKWKSIASHPKVVFFRIRCLTLSSCEEIKESLTTDSEQVASNIHLAFAYHLPNTTKSTGSIQRDYLQASHTFQTLDVRFPEADFVYIEKSVFDDLVLEVLKKCVASLLHNDEFLDDEQIPDLLREYSGKLLHRITSTAQFNDSMWNATFWTDESQRPDIRAKDLEIRFGNEKSWLKRVMRGDNVTSETGISESSPTVAEAIAELRTEKVHVQWSGSDIIIRPFKLWCVALGILRENADFGTFSIWVTKRTADYVTTTHLADRNSAAQFRPNCTPETNNASREAGIAVSHVSQTFDKTFQSIDTARRTSRCHDLKPRGNATWLMRDADTLGSLNHTQITATVRSMDVGGVLVCQGEQFTATTNLFGELSILLPKRNGLQMGLTFEVAGYYSVSLQNVQLDGNPDTINTLMEPLLFISRHFIGLGAATGVLRDFSDWTVLLQNVRLDFRTDMNNHTGTVVQSISTSAAGAWSVRLRSGHYTMTASKNGYVTVPYTVVILGGKRKEFGEIGLSPTLESGAIRVVSLRRNNVAGSEFVRVPGPIEGKSERAHVNWENETIAGTLVKYDERISDSFFHSALITKQLAGLYRVIVFHMDHMGDIRMPTLWELANCGRIVQLYTGNRLWAQYFVPNRMGNAWSVVEINGTHLKTIGEMSTITSRDDVIDLIH